MVVAAVVVVVGAAAAAAGEEEEKGRSKPYHPRRSWVWLPPCQRLCGFTHYPFRCVVGIYGNFSQVSYVEARHLHTHPQH